MKKRSVPEQFLSEVDFHGSRLPVGSGAAAPDSAPTPLFRKESSRVPVAGSGFLSISEPRVATDSDSDSFAWQRAGSRC